MGLHQQAPQNTAAAIANMETNGRLVPGFLYYATDTAELRYARAPNLLSGVIAVGGALADLVQTPSVTLAVDGAGRLSATLRIDPALDNLLAAGPAGVLAKAYDVHPDSDGLIQIDADRLISIEGLKTYVDSLSALAQGLDEVLAKGSNSTRAMSVGALSVAGRIDVADAQESVSVGPGAGASSAATSVINLGPAAGERNTAWYTLNLGLSAGADQTEASGSGQINIGPEAGRHSESRNNIHVGPNAGKNGKSSESIIVGKNAGDFASVSRGVILGLNAGENAKGISDPIFIGFGSGRHVQRVLFVPAKGIEGDGLIGIGAATLQNNTSGYHNIAIGEAALMNNTTGFENTVLGIQAAMLNLIGSYNAYLGWRAGFQNNGNANVYIGESANDQAYNASNNVFVGRRVAHDNGEGSRNVALGESAMHTLQSIEAANMTAGRQYEIFSAGGTPTEFTTLGAPNNDPNTIFTYNGAVVAGDSRVRGRSPEDIPNDNSALGFGAGRYVGKGSGNVFLGASAGPVFGSGYPSNRLYVSNYETNAPLIYGEFDNELLRVNGVLQIRDRYTLPATDGSSGQVMATDGAGNVTFVDAAAVAATTWDQSLQRDPIAWRDAFTRANIRVEGGAITVDAESESRFGLVRVPGEAGALASGLGAKVLIGHTSTPSVLGGTFVAHVALDEGQVGIGTIDPTAKLDVRGTARVEGFRMLTGVGGEGGKVLTADVEGRGTWQPLPARNDGFTDGELRAVDFNALSHIGWSRFLANPRDQGSTNAPPVDGVYWRVRRLNDQVYGSPHLTATGGAPFQTWERFGSEPWRKVPDAAEVQRLDTRIDSVAVAPSVYPATDVVPNTFEFFTNYTHRAPWGGGYLQAQQSGEGSTADFIYLSPDGTTKLRMETPNTLPKYPDSPQRGSAYAASTTAIYLAHPNAGTNYFTKRKVELRDTPPDAAEQFEVLIGFFNHHDQDSDRIAAFRLNRASGLFECVTRDGANETVASIPQLPNFTDPAVYEVRILGTSEVRFFRDNALVAVISANIPTGGLFIATEIRKTLGDEKRRLWEHWAAGKSELV